jgi:transcriptional regulator with XRE-family HTH domain
MQDTQHSENLFVFVGSRIRELRELYNGNKGLSQQNLAEKLDVAPNTISRWETATYHPTLEDLDKMARFFGVSILDFFPKEEAPKEAKLSALLRTAQQLKPNDLEELQRYAEFRKARSIFATTSSRGKVGRKRKRDS